MKKLSQKQIIIKLLREDSTRWWNTYELQKVNTKYGWLGTQADRRARELREAKMLESRPAGQYEQYRYKPTEHEILSWAMQNKLEPDRIYLYGKKENISPVKETTLGTRKENYSPTLQTLFHLREA